MKYYLIGLLSLLLFLPVPVSAHTVGQPPFFKINGVFSNLYPVPSSSFVDFNLPQDLADKNYLTGQTLDFEMDANYLPAPKDIIGQTKFIWDFGDGTRGLGLKNSHQYSKPGSYILSIDAQFITDPTPQLIQSVLFNVLPDKDYKLPQAVIKVNNKSSKDPLTDILKAELNNPVALDGSSSIPGSAKIVSYSWDLGDTNGSSQVSLSHLYDNQLSQIFPVLRVRDENGFIADNFVEVENGPDITQNPVGFVQNNLQPRRLSDNSNPLAQTLIYGGSLAAGIIAALVVIKILRKRKKAGKL